MTVLQSEKLGQAAACLAVLRAQVDTGFTHIKRLCTVDGQTSTQQFDAHQQVSYELAFCVAELEAAEVMLKYADKAAAQDKLCTQLSLAFCAENLRTIWQRLLTHATETGLSSHQLLNLMDNEPLAGFLAEHGSVERYASIGAELLKRGSTRLPSGFDLSEISGNTKWFWVTKKSCR